MSEPLEVVDPPELGRPQGYANGIIVPAGRRLLFVAGQIGWNAEQQLVGDDFVEQFAQALSNVLKVVDAAGGEAADVARLTVYVVDKAEYLASRRELGRRWHELMGRHYPAMALVEVSGLLAPGAKVEIEATAAVPAAAAR
ncbi:MAG TPA: RidA family protein [Thermoanaerobaculia bacterium]|nr:RidA family protein [Thermoanaerobaculia bacterium]